MWIFAAIAALKRSQEIGFKSCGQLPEGEKFWFEVVFWGNIDKAIVKSIWRHYVG